MIDKRYRLVTNLAKQAGQRLLEARKKTIKVKLKNNDPKNIVTNVDFEISRFLAKEIKKSFTHEVIYSEEAPGVEIASGSFWTIDPIDGTACFARNIPHFAVVVGYVEKNVPLVGAIYNPVTRELFSFQKNKGAFFNHQPVGVSQIKKLDQAQVFFRIGRNQKLWNWGGRVYRFLLNQANKTANFGAAALDLCFVGAGRIEACLYGNLTVIDSSAAIGFVQAAGGVVATQKGKKIVFSSLAKQVLLAANNQTILAALKEGTGL